MVLRLSIQSLFGLIILTLHLHRGILVSAQKFHYQSIAENEIMANQIFHRQIRDVQGNSMFQNNHDELPPPYNVEITNINENSIHFQWELTPEAIDRNLEVTVMIYPRDNAYEDLTTVGSRKERIITNLESGKLYTFIIATTKNGEMANPIIINQDTVPAMPTNLKVQTFDFLDIELTFLGQLIPYRIETNGIEAQWLPPDHGECDCYDAKIEPNEGQMIVPSDTETGSKSGNEIRQFIHLVPGKEYTIQVVSTTCGNGFKGPLKSKIVEQILSVPPGNPSKIQVEHKIDTTIEVCWNGPEIGHFDGFEIFWESKKKMYNGDSVMFGHDFIPVDPKRLDNSTYQTDSEHRYCYLIDDQISPCLEYDFEVFTSFNNIMSLGSSKISSFTLPPAPKNFKLVSFGESNIVLSWEMPEDAEKVLGFEMRLPDRNFEHVFPRDKRSIELTNLEPGTLNEIHLLTYCEKEIVDFTQTFYDESDYRIYSHDRIIQQTTKPEKPQKCNLQCVLRNGTVEGFQVRHGLHHMYEGNFGDYNYNYADDFDIEITPDDPFGEKPFKSLRTGKVDNIYTDEKINQLYQNYGMNIGGSWQPQAPRGLGGLDSEQSTLLHEDDYSIKLTQEIYLNTSWLVPQAGRWDGFIIDYSPFHPDEFKNLSPEFRPPYYIDSGSTIKELYLPRSDQTYTIYIRSVANGVESDPLVMKVDCGTPKPKANMCLTNKELPAEINLLSNEVKIPLNNLFFADHIYDPDEPILELENGLVVYYHNKYPSSGGGGYGGNPQMVIKNTDEYCHLHPCKTVKVHFHVCTKGFGCQPKIVTGSCPCDNPDEQSIIPTVPNDLNRSVRPPSENVKINPIRIMPDACCGSKPYNTEDQVCCHDVLYDKPFGVPDTMLCCGNLKYSMGVSKCCLNKFGDQSDGVEFVLKDPRVACDDQGGVIDPLTGQGYISYV